MVALTLTKSSIIHSNKFGYNNSFKLKNNPKGVCLVSDYVWSSWFSERSPALGVCKDLFYGWQVIGIRIVPCERVIRVRKGKYRDWDGILHQLKERNIVTYQRSNSLSTLMRDQHNSTRNSLSHATDTGFQYQFMPICHIFFIFFTFVLQIKILMCRMYTVFHVYFETQSIQYYFAEFNMVQKLKYTKNGVMYVVQVLSRDVVK